MKGIKARPTLYKGIQMRSRLEADYAAHLDRWGAHWEYEPECFASEAGQWLPDFGWSFVKDDSRATLDEVKPAGALIELRQADPFAFHGHVDSILTRMTIAWQSKPDATLQLTFWQYGGPPWLSVIGHSKTHVWYAEFGFQPVYLLWPGMGQVGKCRGREQEASIA